MQKNVRLAKPEEDTAKNDAYSVMKITDLNDDCLLEIFGYLNISELISVSSLCQRFYLNGHQILPKKLQSIDLSDPNSIGFLAPKPYKLGPMRAFFRHFGKNIIKLAFHPNDFKYITCEGAERLDELDPGNVIKARKPARVLDMVAEFTTTLRSLTMRHFGFTQYIMMLVMKTRSTSELFNRLTTLTLHDCTFTGGALQVVTFFRRLENLTSLTIHHYSESFSPIYEIKVDKFFSFMAGSEADFLPFLSGNIDPESRDFFPVEIIPKLKELNIVTESFKDSLPEMITALGSKNMLETMRLTGRREDDDDVLEALLSCKPLNLIEIQPNWTLEDEQMKLLLKKMPNLETVTF